MRDHRQREDQDSEVTLSAASLLGIFLGLVLVCGVFFGFGYSIGRRSPSVASSTAGATGDGEETEMQAPTAAKPSPARIVETDDAASSTGGDGSSNTSSGKSPGGSGLVSLPIVEEPATVKRADAAAAQAAVNDPAGAADIPSAAPAPGLEASASRPEAGRTVVQVAAVSRQEDADVLVSALRQRGYRVIERNEPGDKLLHVQVGPFSSRDEANAMKQKLLADGYNAIIKQ